MRKSFLLNVLVHEDINQDFLLGRDFTGSDAKAFETNDYLFLTDRFDVYWDPRRTSHLNDTLCQVPLHSDARKPLQVATTKVTVIPAFSYVPINTTLSKTIRQRVRLPVKPRGLMTYEVTGSMYPKLLHLPAIDNYVNPNQITVHVFNNSAEDIILEPDTEVAEIQLVDEDTEIVEFQVNNTNYKAFYNDEGKTNPTTYINVNRIHVEPGEEELKKIIEEDEALNENEKDDIFFDSLKRGYHHPSMTKIVEEKSSLTEMYMKSTVPINDVDFEKQFDLKHLKLQNRKNTLKILRLKKEAFSKHACDLGKAKGIEMKITVNNEQPHMQKYMDRVQY